jgi:hypothetical protein
MTFASCKNSPNPIAALGVAAVAVKEGRDTWRGDGCCAAPEFDPGGAAWKADCCD